MGGQISPDGEAGGLLRGPPGVRSCTYIAIRMISARCRPWGRAHNPGPIALSRQPTGMARWERVWVLAERRWCPDQRFSSLDPQFRGEPRPAQHPGLGPIGGSKIVLCGKMLGQCGQQRVPSLIPDRGWLLL
jgi:hypothetical protein